MFWFNFKNDMICSDTLCFGVSNICVSKPPKWIHIRLQTEILHFFEILDLKLLKTLDNSANILNIVCIKMALVINQFINELNTNMMKGRFISLNMEDSVNMRFLGKPIYANPFTSSRSSSAYVCHRFLCQPPGNAQI